jgi:protein TonB
VKKEMAARESGPTKNRSLQLNPRPTAPIPVRAAGRRAQQLKGEGPGLANPMGGPQLRQVAIGGSTIAEHIPGVDEGAFTALNTDQLTYYAFFARVNEQVRNRWVAMIRSYMGSLSEQDLAHLSRSDRQTVIEIVLSKTGEYIRGLLHSSSSVKPLDSAAIEAFRAAAPFLNPPQGLVEADGFIHLRYVFMVRFRPYFGPGSN